MDSLTKTVVVAVAVSLVVLLVVVEIGLNAISKIPNDEKAMILSKSSNSSFTLADGKTCIVNNATLYSLLNVNQTYTFSGYIDYNSKIFYVEKAKIEG